MRFSTDVGGTFTDLIVEDERNLWWTYKTPTVPGDAAQGVIDVLTLAAQDRGYPLSSLLKAGDTFIHGTTHALNSLVTGRTARTAFLTTEGHPDILTLREGGRGDPFNHTQAYPQPYVPRSLTFEVRERVGSDGAVIRPLDEASAIERIAELSRRRVEAVAVCLLWSVSNPKHELRIGELLDERLPGVPYTLSHRLNPVIREYRRASSAAIDASLKPLMTGYLCNLTRRLRAAGFAGRILTLTSQGAVLDAEDALKAPIHLLNSGPSMAPVAGRLFGRLETGATDLIVADAGGTTYDVSLVRDGRIPITRETWIGRPFLGHMTGFPSVDVKSIGAGGGSVAWIDSGGGLHVGPRSMGAEPGPACYGLGGVEPTVTDAAVVLGYLDPANFLGGRIPLDPQASSLAIETGIGSKLGLGAAESAWAILSVATEDMAQAILEITVNQGIDPRRAALIAGGGASGLNATFVARRLACPELIIPAAGAALSAAGALIADLRFERRKGVFLSTASFDRSTANEVLAALTDECRAALPQYQWIEYSVDARYRNQVWEIQTPLRAGAFSSEGAVAQFIEDFHSGHERIFGVRDPGSPVEIVNWSATACCRLHDAEPAPLAESPADAREPGTRLAYFEGMGMTRTPVYRLADLEPEVNRRGPALVESPFTTVVVDPHATFKRTARSSLVIHAI